jgi:hypothetical protein
MRQQQDSSFIIAAGKDRPIALACNCGRSIWSHAESLGVRPDDIEPLLEEMSPADPCYCGSAKKFKFCCSH